MDTFLFDTRPPISRVSREQTGRLKLHTLCLRLCALVAEQLQKVVCKILKYQSLEKNL